MCSPWITVFVSHIICLGHTGTYFMTKAVTVFNRTGHAVFVSHIIYLGHTGTYFMTKAVTVFNRTGHGAGDRLIVVNQWYHK